MCLQRLVPLSSNWWNCKRVIREAAATTNGWVLFECKLKRHHDSTQLKQKKIGFCLWVLPTKSNLLCENYGSEVVTQFNPKFMVCSLETTLYIGDAILERRNVSTSIGHVNDPKLTLISSVLLEGNYGKVRSFCNFNKTEGLSWDFWKYALSVCLLSLI